MGIIRVSGYSTTGMLHNKSMVSLAPSKTACSLLLEFNAAHRFSSSCTAFDALLTPPNPDGNVVQPDGFAQGAVLELMGPPGIGKTRSAMSFILGERFNAVMEAGTSAEAAHRHVLVVGEHESRRLAVS